MEAANYIKKINEILAIKAGVLEEILLITKNQKKTLAENRYDELDLLIEEKQAKMDAVDKLDIQFLKYTQNLKDLLSINSLEELPKFNLPETLKLRNLTERIHELLSEIKVCDNENKDLLSRKIQDIKNRVNYSNTFKKMNQAYYSNNSDAPPFFFDKKK